MGDGFETASATNPYVGKTFGSTVRQEAVADSAHTADEFEPESQQESTFEHEGHWGANENSNAGNNRSLGNQDFETQHLTSADSGALDYDDFEPESLRGTRTVNIAKLDSV